jgi:HAD superfamily hydrolase (TIGR01484 family)
MRYLALAADFDGTLAHHGKVDEMTLAALKRLRESGRRLIMVTGREMPDLKATFPHTDLFDRIVAENGALLVRPDTGETRTLADAPPPAFVEKLKAHGVGPISTGHVIVATWEPHEKTVLEVIHELGLELHVIFNKGAVMVLPSGVNKATGLTVALDDLCLSPHNAVGVGDAENDHAFLALCECAAAVDNALPAVKERADVVTPSGHGAGVTELIGWLLEDDLADVAPRLQRHEVLLGKRADGGPETLSPYGLNVLVCGTSGSGKSTLTTGLLERLNGAGYQFAIIDPEGDYSELDFAVVLGNTEHPPPADEVLHLLAKPGRNAVVNLLGVPLGDRPAYFDALLPRLTALRAKTGRPHWIVVDEAHHLLPTAWVPGSVALPSEMLGMLYISVHPGSVSHAVLKTIDVLLAVGKEPAKTLHDFCTAAGVPPVPGPEGDLVAGDAVVWRRGVEEAVLVHTEPPKAERQRHSRKYAEGNLGADRSFYFRGPKGKLNLRAQNLALFLQMAEGVDDATWEYHLRKGEYSGWFAEQIKDAELAAEAREIEQGKKLSAQESRAAVRKAIEKRYTLPADKPTGVVDPQAAAR